MGGYGALVSGGARLAQAALTLERAGEIADAAGQQHCARWPTRGSRRWSRSGRGGGRLGLWDAAGMAGLSVPALIIAGSRRTTVSGYDTGMRLIFDEAVGVDAAFADL